MDCESKKKTKGRRKIPIEKKQSRCVAFTKRRHGLFKKAEELSILCGAQISILVRSEGDKIFSFGSLPVEDVLGRFQNNGGGDHHREPVSARQTPELIIIDDLDEESGVTGDIGQGVEEGFVTVDQNVFLSSEVGESDSEYDLDLFWSELDHKNAQQQQKNIWFS